jgi:hypothetical protein
MSSGDVRLNGGRLVLTAYAALRDRTVKAPERTLFDSIRFSSRGVPARAVKPRAAATRAAQYICSAVTGSQAVERLDVECTFTR